MVVRICMGIQFQLLSATIYYGPQSDIRVKTFARQNSPESSLLNFECIDRLSNLFGDSGEKSWQFEFMMRFVFQLRASHYNMSFNRTSKSKVMVVRMCLGIPFQLSSAMVYYGPQSDNRVKTFARWNLPQSSLLNFECLIWFPALCGNPKEWLWPFVFSMGFSFQQRASQYIINIYWTSKSKVMAVRICVCIRFPLLNAIIYYGAQLDIREKTFACQNLPESSLFISGCLNRFPALCGDPKERLWSFVFVMGFIFQRASQYIIKVYRTSESKVMDV